MILLLVALCVCILVIAFAVRLIRIERDEGEGEQGGGHGGGGGGDWPALPPAPSGGGFDIDDRVMNHWVFEVWPAPRILLFPATPHGHKADKSEDDHKEDEHEPGNDGNEGSL